MVEFLVPRPDRFKPGVSVAGVLYGGWMPWSYRLIGYWHKTTRVYPTRLNGALILWHEEWVVTWL